MQRRTGREEEKEYCIEILWPAQPEHYHSCTRETLHRIAAGAETTATNPDTDVRPFDTADEAMHGSSEAALLPFPRQLCASRFRPSALYVPTGDGPPYAYGVLQVLFRGSSKLARIPASWSSQSTAQPPSLLQARVPLRVRPPPHRHYRHYHYQPSSTSPWRHGIGNPPAHGIVSRLGEGWVVIFLPSPCSSSSSSSCSISGQCLLPASVARAGSLDREREGSGAPRSEDAGYAVSSRD
ncbi:hypothetical protein GGR56DRAFT_94772 [Xylariaceae sp. FL0804]|nr:hypothetical protein GGR56DRAFT_94772 [Xylariaceae sp. FL0804]